MKAPQDIILRPIISEKMEFLKDAQRKYAFQVRPDANKIEIAQAVEKIYKVTVMDVNVMHKLGKKRRLRFIEGKRPDWTKAIVTLEEGDAIEYFK